MLITSRENTRLLQPEDVGLRIHFDFCGWCDSWLVQCWEGALVCEDGGELCFVMTHKNAVFVMPAAEGQIHDFRLGFPWALPRATLTMAVGQIVGERRWVWVLTFAGPFLMKLWWVVAAASGVLTRAAARTTGFVSGVVN